MITTALFAFLTLSSCSIDGTLQYMETPPAEEQEVPAEHTLSFRVSHEEGAYISGITTQTLLPGERSTRVEAMSTPGYEFVEWSDGEENPVRQNLAITEDTELTAIYRETRETVPALYLKTARGISSKDTYISCMVSVDNVLSRFELDSIPATIKGRGNSSWGFEKKSYSLKLKESQKLCGLGTGKSKSWVLSASHCDQSFMRNYMGYWLQRQLTNIPWGQECCHVDLYLNGEYQGVYLLSEKISANENKIDILTYDDTGELDAQFLLELDNYAGQTGPKGVTWFTVSGYPYLIKGEDTVTTERNTYIDETLTNIYNTVLEGNEKKIDKVFAIDAAVDIYLLEEIAKNIDCGWSSFYLHMGNDGKLYLGPAWDFDIAMGNDYRLDDGSPEKIYAGDGSYGFSQQNPWFIALMKQDWFRDRVSTRLAELIDAGVFEEMTAEIDRVWNNCAPSFIRNFEKWPIFGRRIFYETEYIMSLDTAEEHVMYLKEWLTDRVEWLAGYFLND